MTENNTLKFRVVYDGLAFDNNGMDIRDLALPF